MNISRETEELFVKWALEAAGEAAKREGRVRVLALRWKIQDHLERLNGGKVEFVGSYRTKDYIKLSTDYAKAVARTTFREAQTTATLDQCARFENDLVQVWDIGTDCEICRRHEGVIYSISGNNPKYPPLKEKPPFHLNCRHGLDSTSEEAIRVRASERPPYEGLNPDDRCILRINGKTRTNREMAEFRVEEYGDKEAAAWLASLKGDSHETKK